MGDIHISVNLGIISTCDMGMVPRTVEMQVCACGMNYFRIIEFNQVLTREGKLLLGQEAE